VLAELLLQRARPGSIELLQQQVALHLPLKGGGHGVAGHPLALTERARVVLGARHRLLDARLLRQRQG